METTRVSTKGQIVLPRRIRVARAWAPGTELAVEETRDGVLLRPVARLPVTTLDEVAGCLRSKGTPKAISQMHDAVRREVIRRHDRGRY